LKASTLAEPTFVGRTNELSQLMLFLDSMIKGEGSTVLISGEAGSGKTRLLKEFLDAAKNRGVAVLSGWCLSNASVPYFPFIEAFSSFNDYNQELNGVLSGQERIRAALFGETTFEENNSHHVLNPSVWKEQLFATITKELLLLSNSKPTILFIDDIHWADSASLALLHYIAHVVSSERLLLMATFRSEEIMGTYDGKMHPLAELLLLMGRESLYDKIKLTSLSQSEIGLIGESMLGGSLSKDFVEMLSDESRGNALFVVEVLRLLFSQGSLIKDKGYWQLLDGRIDFPQKVRDVIFRRIGALKPNQRRILDVASIIGEKFNPKLIGYALSEKNIDVLETLSSIAQSTLLVYCEDNFYRFKHAKIQEMIYSEIDPLLKKEYHLRVADCLETNIMEHFPASDIFHHYAMAGDSEKAIKYALAAGKDALDRWSNVEAINYFSFVLGKPNISNEVRDFAMEGLGDAYFANCRFELAIQTYNGLYEGSEKPIVKLRALRKQMDAFWFKERDPAPLIKLLEKTESLANIDRLEDARILWNKARLTVWSGQEQLKQALFGHEQALKIFEEEFSLLDTASIVWPVGIIRIWLGSQVDRGIGEILRGIAMLHELGDTHGEVLAYHVGAIDMLGICGLFEESYSCQLKMVKLAEKVGEFDSLAFGWLRLSEGPTLERNYAEALRYCLKALEYSAKSDAKGVQSQIYAKLTRLYVLQGDLNKAKEYLKIIKDLSEEVKQLPSNAYHILCAESIFLVATKQLDLGLKLFEKAKGILSKAFPKGSGVSVWIKCDNALILELTGNIMAAQKERMEIKRIIDAEEEKFNLPNLYASLMMKKDIYQDTLFEIRFDLVNVSKKPITILKIENAFSSEIEIVDLPVKCKVCSNGNIELFDTDLKPFEAYTFKFKAKTSTLGNICLAPNVIYSGSGIVKNYRVEVRTLFVKFGESEKTVRMPIGKLKFETASAEKAFDFLVKAFVQDYCQRKFPIERAGWRTLMDIVRDGKLTLYSVYGSSSNNGKAILDLKGSGLVEIRTFEGERGRGGKIVKLRVNIEKIDVKNLTVNPK
jgi:tetratricopeptide (TPR) repeat protein